MTNINKKGLAPTEWNPNIRQCTATSKRTGERCKNPAVTGYDVCRVHGAHKKKPKSQARKTTNALKSNVIKKYKNRINKAAKELGVELPDTLKHGFLAFEILNETERQDFLGVVNQMHADFQINKSSDFYAVEMVATNLILFRRAAKNGDVKAAEAYDRMVRMHLGDLKATKNAREGETLNIKTTPAEWAASILKRVNEENKRNHEGVPPENDTEREKSVAFDGDEAAKNSDKTKTLNS